MSIIQTAQIGKLGLDLKRRTDEPSNPHEMLVSGVDGKAHFSQIQMNPKAISRNVTIYSDMNASSIGPVTVNNGVIITVEDEGVWVII